MREDKFSQPVDSIEIISRADGPRSILNAEALQAGRDRIAAGEDPDEVALDLAMDEVALLGIYNENGSPRTAGGSGSGNFGHAGRKGEIGGSASAHFADAPLTKAGGKAWAKAHQDDYTNDIHFRAAVDAVTLLTQGSTNAIFAASLHAAGRAKDISVDFWRKAGDQPLSVAENPMSGYKTYFKGQDLAAADYITLREAGAALNHAVETSPPLDVPIFRGMQVSAVDSSKSTMTKTVDNPAYVRIAKLKVGDSLELPGISSFTAEKQTAIDFAHGEARGQASYQYNRKHPEERRASAVTFEVLPGARGLKVAALSPWDQKEVLTRGKFKVKDIQKTSYGYQQSKSDFHIVLEQAS